MKTILKAHKTEEVIKNSKFISLLIPISNKEDIKIKLKEIKQSYPRANHYCYAYILENDQGMSDDGEPAKTAGAPLYTILEKEDLINVLAVVIRYFGGIKLGTGGLIRAYSHGIQSILQSASMMPLTNGLRLQITFPFSKEKKIQYLLKPSQILERKYDTICHYIIEIEENKLEIFNNLVTIEQKEKKLVRKID